MKLASAAKIASAAVALKNAPLSPVKANRFARPVNVDWVAPQVKASFPDPHNVQFPKHV